MGYSVHANIKNIYISMLSKKTYWKDVDDRVDMMRSMIIILEVCDEMDRLYPADE